MLNNYLGEFWFISSMKKWPQILNETIHQPKTGIIVFRQNFAIPAIVILGSESIFGNLALKYELLPISTNISTNISRYDHVSLII